MNITINFNIDLLRDNSLSLNEYITLLHLSYKIHGIDINYTPFGRDYIYLRDNGYVTIDKENVSLTDKGLSFIKLMEKSDEVKKSKRDYESLAEKLRQLFPKGLKDGKYPWRASVKVIEARLKALDKGYGLSSYSDDNIIDATRAYVNRFERSPEGMRLLIYFLLKDGNSDLISYLEVEEDKEIKRNNFKKI